MPQDAALNPQIPLGMEEARVILFAQPANNDEWVLGTDSETGESFTNLATVNTLIRAIENQALSGDRVYVYDIRRDGYSIRKFHSSQVKNELPGPIWPGFPLNLRNAMYQIYMRQTVTGSGLQARQLTMIWQKALV